ncbi:hypothetical protein VTJ04DRAFT_9401 [Mycothermus thermophilus]|uniref:uncharacterized protein n=1 Tax=Humicola insolens TaxID=85995 RepID=UPI0037433DC9
MNKNKAVKAARNPKLAVLGHPPLTHPFYPARFQCHPSTKDLGHNPFHLCLTYPSKPTPNIPRSDQSQRQVPCMYRRISFAPTGSGAIPHLAFYRHPFLARSFHF